MKRTLTIRYPERMKPLHDIRRQGSRWVMTSTTRSTLEPGEEVVVCVVFPTQGRTFRLEGTVEACQHTALASVSPDQLEVTIDLKANRSLHMVLDHARDKLVDFEERKGRRVPCSIDVTYRRGNNVIQELAEDIGEGGVFIRTGSLCPIGTQVECRLKPPGRFTDVKLEGRVVWLNWMGQPRGMGIEFLFSSRRQKRKVIRIVDRVASRKTHQIFRRMLRHGTD